MSRRAALALAVALAAAVGCGSGGTGLYEVRVGGALLADADGVAPLAAPEAPLLELVAGGPDPAVPAGGAARLAIGRTVRWRRIEPVLRALADAGVRPELLVGFRDAVRAFALSDGPLDGPAIAVTATADGKFCVGPPSTNLAKCVQTSDRTNINRGFVREIVRDAVRAYQLQDVDVLLAPDLRWADVIHTVDGARTCCGKTAIRVHVQGDPGAE